MWLESGVKRTNPAVISTAIAHTLAWAAFLWLVLWPYAYQGETVTPVGPDGAGGASIRESASFIEVNGLQVLPLLLVPVVLTGLGFLTTRLWSAEYGLSERLLRINLWFAAILLLGFCLVAIASVGIFYLPAAMALIVSAAINSDVQRVKE